MYKKRLAWVVNEMCSKMEMSGRIYLFVVIFIHWSSVHTSHLQSSLFAVKPAKKGFIHWWCSWTTLTLLTTRPQCSSQRGTMGRTVKYFPGVHCLPSMGKCLPNRPAIEVSGVWFSERKWCELCMTELSEGAVCRDGHISEEDATAQTSTGFLMRPWLQGWRMRPDPNTQRCSWVSLGDDGVRWGACG